MEWESIALPLGVLGVLGICLMFGMARLRVFGVARRRGRSLDGRSPDDSTRQRRTGSPLSPVQEIQGVPSDLPRGDKSRDTR